MHSTIIKVQMCPHLNCDFLRASKQFWLNALPGGINYSHGPQQDMNPGSLGESPLSHSCSLAKVQNWCKTQTSVILQTYKIPYNNSDWLRINVIQMLFGCSMDVQCHSFDLQGFAQLLIFQKEHLPCNTADHICSVSHSELKYNWKGNN